MSAESDLYGIACEMRRLLESISHPTDTQWNLDETRVIIRLSDWERQRDQAVVEQFAQLQERTGNPDEAKRLRTQWVIP